MTAIEASDHVNETPARSDVVGVLRGAWNNVVRRHRERQAIMHISRLSPHLIDDIGFDPERFDAGKGVWDGTLVRWPDWHPSLPR